MALQLFAAAWAAIVLCSSFAQAQDLEAFPCDNMRREWRQLTPGQQATYISAINQLQNSRQYPNWLATHVDPNMDRFAHASDGFFPWHRWYLWNFENQIRQLGGSYACISIPYWDWTSDAATYGGNFGASPCYLAFGGPGGGQCVEQLIGSNTGPPFASFNAFRYPNDFSGRYAGGCVTRRHVFQRLAMPQEMIDILTRNTAYTADPRFRVGFRYAIANSHNGLHNMVGGSMGTVASGYDPIFMMHHSFIDKLWATWQSCHGTNNFPAVFGDDSNPAVQWSAQNAMPGFPTAVSPMMVADISTIGGRGYSYSASALEQTPQWQASITNPGVCARLVTGRDLAQNEVRVQLSQRELDAVDIYARTMKELRKTSNDTKLNSFMATRKTCEAANNIGEYKEASNWAKMMGTTAQELLSNMNSPCVDVKFPDTEKALADARAYDAKVAREFQRKLEAAKSNASSRLVPSPAEFYPYDRQPGSGRIFF